MDIRTALDKLFSLHIFGVKLGLDKIKAFLDYIGKPQLKLKVIHLAGSNGKGSTAAFISSMLMEAGYKVGLYTSPHFIKFNERIVINGVQIDDEYVARFITKHWKYIIEHELTFFEVTTALAFEFFFKSNVDYAVIETGLGGRLDATNTLNPLAVVITSISLEHTNVLGKSLTEITKEKAAIIKSKIKVFTSSLPEESEKIIQTKCVEENSELYTLKKHFDSETNLLKTKIGDINFENLNVPLNGMYQKNNALLAILTIVNSGLVSDKKILFNGISKMVLNIGFQGRYEYYNKYPTVIMDSAHNVDGLRHFLEEFNNESKQYKKKIVIFGVMRDKAVEGMLLELNKNFDEILLADIKYERSIKYEELQNICKKISIIAHGVSEPVDFIRNFLKGDKDSCLVILGSMYLLGDVKTGLKC